MTQTLHSIPAADLRARLSGRVIAPTDDGYERLRTVFPGNIDRRPALITRPAHARDVAHVLAFAQETGLPLAVRGGGHSGAGHGVTEGGLVVDVRDLRTLEIDHRDATVWAGAGLSAGEYSTEVGAHGLATGFGDTGSVGIGGITLGGGIGYLARRHGLTIDNVLAAEIVTANGEILHVDETNHPDLFWAIRGGGGNFGVVTRFRYQLHAVPQVVGGMLMLPATPEIIVGAIEASAQAPEALSVIVNVMPAPPLPFVPEAFRGQPVVLLLLCYAGDAEAGARAVAPLRALAPPIVDMVRPMRYPELFPPEDPSYRPSAAMRTLFIERLDRAAASTILDFLQRSTASVRVAQLRVLGGAVARTPVEATAFAHRHEAILVNVAAFVDTPEDRAAREQWVQEFAGAIDQGRPGAYVGFLGDEGAARVRAAYPAATWERLAAIKGRYDPTNLFRSNQNVTPR